MKRGFSISRLIYLMALLLSLVLIGPRAQANSEGSLYLKIPEYGTIVSQLGTNTSGHELTAWRLSDQYDLSSQDVVKALHSMSEEELNQQFTSGRYGLVFHADQLEVKGFSEGTYYIRQVLKTDKVSYTSAIAFAIKPGEPAPVVVPKKVEEPTRLRLVKTDESGKPLAKVGFRLYGLDKTGKQVSLPLVDGYRYQEGGELDKVLYTDEQGVITISHLPYGRYRFVEVEPLPGYRLGKGQVEATVDSDRLVQVGLVNEKIPAGNARFMKIDGKTKSALSGAVFKVLKKEGSQFMPVLRGGKELVLTSDSEGYFTAEGLEYGEYYLREVQPPRGYSQLGSSVSFRVDSSDSTHQITAIENQQRPKIEVPNTGDMILYVLMFLSLVFFGSGWYLTQKPRFS